MRWVGGFGLFQGFGELNEDIMGGEDFSHFMLCFWQHHELCMPFRFGGQMLGDFTYNV